MYMSPIGPPVHACTSVSVMYVHVSYRATSVLSTRELGETNRYVHTVDCAYVFQCGVCCTAGCGEGSQWPHDRVSAARDD